MLLRAALPLLRSTHLLLKLLHALLQVTRRLPTRLRLRWLRMRRLLLWLTRHKLQVLLWLKHLAWLSLLLLQRP